MSQLEYYMTEVGGWQMTSSIDSFRQGVAAFRNVRDLEGVSLGCGACRN